MLRAAVLALCLASLAGGGARAQSVGVPVAPVLVLDTEQLLAATFLGRGITADLQKRMRALAAENRRIASELEAEERELTELRPTLDPAEFRRLADAFDEKVQRIRREQDAKQRELEQLRVSERQAFMDRIAPILSDIALERGALIIMERRNVLLSAGRIDITREAIRRVNATLDASAGGVPEAGEAAPGEAPGEAMPPAPGDPPTAGSGNGSGNGTGGSGNGSWGSAGDGG